MKFSIYRIENYFELQIKCMVGKEIDTAGMENDIRYRGYYEADHFDFEEIWTACNYIDQGKRKPENLHADIGSCTSDIIIYDPQEKIYHMALPVGQIAIEDIEPNTVVNIIKNYWDTRKK